MAGRPTKLTPECMELFTQTLAAGNYFSVAATVAGIDNSTYCLWMKTGKKAESGPYLEFYKAVKKAEAEAEASRVARVSVAGQNGVWQADAWYLERRYPDRWGKQTESRSEDATISDTPTQELSEKEACEKHGVSSDE